MPDPASIYSVLDQVKVLCREAAGLVAQRYRYMRYMIRPEETSAMIAHLSDMINSYNNRIDMAIRGSGIRSDAMDKAARDIYYVENQLAVRLIDETELLPVTERVQVPETTQQEIEEIFGDRIEDNSYVTLPRDPDYDIDISFEPTDLSVHLEKPTVDENDTNDIPDNKLNRFDIMDV